MIKGKEYYFICKDVKSSIKKGLVLNQVNLTLFGAEEIAGFLTCNDCLGDEPEVENFFNNISPNLKEYRFKKRKQLRAWADDQVIVERPFEKMANNWWAGDLPSEGSRVLHCDDCAEAPVVFVLKFELDPLDMLELEEARRLGEDVPSPEETPDFVLLCGACYETLDPEELLEETLDTTVDAEMLADLQKKVCCFMDYDTFYDRFYQRNSPDAPDIGDVVAFCDHMMEEPEHPLHHWYVEPAGIEIETIEGKRPRTEEIKWLMCCNGCNQRYEDPMSVLDNGCAGNLYIVWDEEDYELFPIYPPDAEDDMSDF